MADYAWMLAATTDPGYRDPHRAIELANKLIEKIAEGSRGLDDPRGGPLPRRRLERRDRRLEKSEAVAPGRLTAANGFFLAMAYRAWVKRTRDANGTRRPYNR